MRSAALLAFALCGLLALCATAGAQSAQEGEKDYEVLLERARDAARRAAVSGDAVLAAQAAEGFEAAARLRPKDPVPPAEAGMLALDMGDGAGAAKMLARAHDADPESGPYRFLRGRLLQVRGEFADATKEYLAARAAGYRTGPCSDRIFECTLGYGHQLAEDGRFDDALARLEEAVAMKPDHPLVPGAFVRMALVHRRLQEPAEAEKALRLCTERFPSYATGFGELADLLADLERFDEAIEALERALRADAGYSRGWILLARVRTLRGEMAKAEEAFREFEKRSPPDGESEFYRGLFLQRSGKPEKAVERLRRSLALDPTRARCHYLLSLCYRDLAMEEEAAAELGLWRKAEEARQKEMHDHEERTRRGAPAPGGDRPAGEAPKDGG